MTKFTEKQIEEFEKRIKKSYDEAQSKGEANKFGGTGKDVFIYRKRKGRK